MDRFGHPARDRSGNIVEMSNALCYYKHIEKFSKKNISESRWEDWQIIRPYL